MSFTISPSGMAVNRTWMNVIAHNLANVNTTRTEEGTPYRRRNVILEESNKGRSFRGMLQDAVEGNGGVRLREIVQEENNDLAFQQVFDPTHPDANAEGFVLKPNINPVVEMVHLMSAARAFEANVAAFNSARQVFRKALEIGT